MDESITPGNRWQKEWERQEHRNQLSEGFLNSPPDIQVAVERNGVISMGHARAIINVDVVDKQLYIYFLKLKNRGLSVRQTEDLVK